MPNTPNPIDGYKSQLREIKAEMKRRGVRRISCFNGGLTVEEKHYNQEIFRLSTEIKKLEGK